LSVAILVASGVLQAEDREQLVGGGGVDGLQAPLGVVVGVEVAADGVGGLLVGQLAEIFEAAWGGRYRKALTPAEIWLLASPVISWELVHAACPRQTSANSKIHPIALIF
jgi:hypothetical protein